MSPLRRRKTLRWSRKLFLRWWLATAFGRCGKSCCHCAISGKRKHQIKQHCHVGPGALFYVFSWSCGGYLHACSPQVISAEFQGNTTRFTYCKSSIKSPSLFWSKKFIKPPFFWSKKFIDYSLITGIFFLHQSWHEFKYSTREFWWKYYRYLY